MALAYQLFGGAVTIALNFLLVPAHAATGAAVADIGGQLVAVIPIVAYASARVGPRAVDVPAFLRAALASAPAGLAAWLLDEALGGVAGLVLGALVAVVVFSVLAVLLRIVPGRGPHVGV